MRCRPRDILSPLRGERSDCAAIRVRGRSRESEPSDNAPSSRPSPRTRGEGASKHAPDSALNAAVAEIQTAFSRAAEIESFKRRIAYWLRLGPQHPATRARFRAHVAALPDWRLDVAIDEVERWWREERKCFALASALGYGSRLPVQTLRELRLILRLLRVKNMAAQCEAIAAAVCEQDIAPAAE